MTPSPRETTARPKPGPLVGVRVLDLGDPLALYGTKLLADLGGDVILVEPPGGVSARRLPPFYHNDPSPNRSLTFWFYATSRRSVTCDLHTSDGRALFARLVRTAQVVVTGGPPGWLDRLGIGYERFKLEQSGLIWASVTGFGDWGPRAEWLSSDLIGVAVSGIMTLAGYPDRPPYRPPELQGAMAAGIQAAQGILMALRVAERSGIGQKVEVSMQEALSLAQETAMQTYDMRGEVRKRTGESRLLPGIGAYPCADGYIYSMVGIPGFGASWPVLAGWMDEEGMADDLLEERWQTILTRTNLRELTSAMSDPKKLAALQVQFLHVNEVLGRFYAKFPKQHLYEQGQSRRLLIGPVNSPRDLAENKQLNARGWFQPLDHPELSDTILYPGPPFRMDASPWQLSRRPPLIGEHNLEIWRDELGCSSEQLTAVSGAGVL
ncbi:MAG: CaiB/BaiF CoA transferase family protein [Dehalococcoidia bacterium]